MSKVKKQQVFLPNGAFAVDKKGNAVKVNSIIAPQPDDCCMLDCCDQSIKFIDNQGNKRSIPLQALYDLLNP